MVMTEEIYNANDTLYLFSCGLDETLSDKQRRDVDKALAALPSLSQQAEALRATAVLLGRWSKQRLDCDWARQAQSISDQIGDGTTGEFDQLDALLGRWSATRASFDADAFTAGVVARVEQASARGATSKALFRIGAPLAAAAAIALVVVGTLWFQTPLASSVHVVYYSSAARGDAAVGAGRVECLVAYHRDPVEPHSIGGGVPGLSFISVGSSPLRDSFEEQPPI